MQIKNGEILGLATQEIFLRGMEYYRNGRVRLVHVEDNSVTARVRGKAEYSVTVHRNGSGFVAQCTCPLGLTCKHIIATLLTARDHHSQNHAVTSSSLAESQQEKLESDWHHFFHAIHQSSSSGQPPVSSTSSERSNWGIYFTIRLGRDVWTITAFRARRRKDGTYGAAYPTSVREQPYYHLAMSQKENLALMLLDSTDHAHTYPYHYLHRNGYQLGYGQRNGMLFDLLRDSDIYLEEDEARQNPLRIGAETARFEIRLQEDGDYIQLQPAIVFPNREIPLDNDTRILTSDPLWMLRGTEIFKIDHTITIESDLFSNRKNPRTNHTARGQRIALVDFLQAFRRQKTVAIPKAELSEFFASLSSIPQLLSHLSLPDRDSLPAINRFEGKHIYLEESTEGLIVRLKFVYGNREVECEAPSDFGDLPPAPRDFLIYAGSGLNFLRVIRDREGEAQALERLQISGARQSAAGAEFIVRDGRATDWLLLELPKLIEDGFRIFGEDKLKRHKVRRAKPILKVKVNSEIDWFDVQLVVDFDGILLSLKELRKSLAHRSRYVKLGDGSTALLPEEWIEQFSHLVNLSENKEEGIKVSRHHLTLIDTLCHAATLKEADQDYYESLQRLRDFQGIQEVTVTENFHGELRPYQKQGLSWLYFLQEFRFGGCLADDMGLGKTIQALSLLQNEKDRGVTAPSLIVCPTSVLFNWEKEIQRFTPALRYLIHTGLERRRQRQFENCNLVLTSYGILRRDIEFLKDAKFHYAILDESQKVKNPLSQTAKAVRLLQANHRLALTGTPVENNAQELWSQFAFLNPGLLGSLNYFKRAFTRPIEKEKNETTAHLLRKLIFPFVLRRTKNDVARELPDKVENLYYCTMSEPQQKVYNMWRDYYRAHVMEQINLKGLQKSRMYVLQGLTRLRQICCHPGLTEKKYHHESGKFEALKEILETILAEDHKVLVFSQFVRMLRIISGYLNENAVPYAYLDGHTKDREQPVQQFQTDPAIRVFLISLRAGGFGLNLTAADYVILYDPWWNPAVEAQAIDRTHRIGQDKQVFSYKLIMRDSVEEKILQLQDRKKKLVSELIATDSGMFKHLTVEDIEVLFS
jgi:non-specific serine/threonine protein kinase